MRCGRAEGRVNMRICIVETYPGPEAVSSDDMGMVVQVTCNRFTVPAALRNRAQGELEVVCTPFVTTERCLLNPFTCRV